MKTPDHWAEAAYDLVSIKCKDVWHMPEVRALVSEIQADARRAALEPIQVAVTALKKYDGGYYTGYYLATRPDDELAPDALHIKRLWQAIDRALLDDAGRAGQ